jgi:hypothetical protein
MLARTDYNQLLEFKHLEKLFVGENVLQNLYDCNNVLKYVPHLLDFFT